MKNKKIPHADIRDLILVFGNPFPLVRFVQQDFDRRQWWLEVSNGLNTYFTSVSISKWKKFNFESKSGVIRHAIKKLNNP